jgi:hypothetical protein
MHGEEVDFERRLRDALEGYRPLLGRCLAIEDVDPRSRRLRDAYRAFSDASRGLDVPPDRGEWADFEGGRKPMLRLVLSKAAWASLRELSASKGYAIAEADLAVREAADGRVVPSGENTRVVGFVGREPRDVTEAARVDGELLASGNSPEAWRTLGRRLGALLGYPRCCVDHFVGLAADAGNDEVVRAVARGSGRFLPWLNNVSMSVYHAISWFPCRYDCEASTRVARAVEQRVRAAAGRKHHRVLRYLSMPRLYFDDRRQLIFEGATERNGRVRYRAVHSPFTFDRRRDDALGDWLFHVEVVTRLATASCLETHGEEAVAESEGKAETIRWTMTPVWMPFGLSGW